METIKQLKNWLKKPRTKKRIYAALVLLVACLVAYRFAMVAAQNRLDVYNPARAAIADGVVVDTLVAQSHKDVLKEPITVKNNRAYVSGARAHMLRAGQHVGDGTIASVSSNIDLDTGMYAVRTRGVADGLQYVTIEMKGYFVPVYALDRGVVFVVENGVATTRNVTVSAQDADMAYITSGLKDGDIVILSKVTPNAKVLIKE